MWLLSSKNTFIETAFDVKINFSNHVLVTNEYFFEYKTQSIHLIVFGNPWPRYEIQKENLDKTDFKWLISCIENKKFDFINYIKGDFVIFIVLENTLNVYNDHFGISPIYFNLKTDAISNSFTLLKSQSRSFNERAIAQHIYFNRTIGNTTYDENVENLEGANQIEFSNNTLKKLKYWNYKNDLTKKSKNYSLQNIIDFSKENIDFFYQFFDVNQTYITLTGGKDSRSALAILLNLGLNPIGLNYGSNKSKDIVFARKLANEIGIECKTIHVKTDSDDYYLFLNELMQDHPMISIHRAHRYAAFKEIDSENNFNVLFNGYMGGEMLMGIYPDKLVFTEQVLNLINNKKEISNSNYFETELTSQLLQSHASDKSFITSDFEAIFTIGIKHHLQDIHISKKYCKYVFPFFLDVDFIERIFNSNFNFRMVDNKSKNLLRRYNLYMLNCELQYQLSPQLRNIPFAKKGNYTLQDYKKGPFFWSLKKVLNHFREKKYPPNFTYDFNYLLWITEKLEEMNSNKSLKIHQYFNVSEALKTIKKTYKTHFSESELLPYSRIIMFSNYLSNLA